MGRKIVLHLHTNISDKKPLPSDMQQAVKHFILRTLKKQ